MNAVAFADVLSTLAFLVAAVLVAVLPYDEILTKPARAILVAAMLLYVFVGISNVLEHAGITAKYDYYEDFAEILFIPALAYVANSVYLTSELRKSNLAARAQMRQNDLLLNIVDTVPGGIVLVDPTGGVTFANEGAERVLGLASDEGGSLRITPPWRLSDPLTGEEVTFAELASGGELVRRPLRATWPDGQVTELTLSVTPMASGVADIGGSVIAFEDTTPRS